MGVLDASHIDWDWNNEGDEYKTQDAEPNREARAEYKDFAPLKDGWKKCSGTYYIEVETGRLKEEKPNREYKITKRRDLNGNVKTKTYTPKKKTNPSTNDKRRLTSLERIVRAAEQFEQRKRDQNIL